MGFCPRGGSWRPERPSPFGLQEQLDDRNGDVGLADGHGEGKYILARPAHRRVLRLAGWIDDLRRDFRPVMEELREANPSGQPGQVNMPERPREEVQIEAVTTLG